MTKKLKAWVKKILFKNKLRETLYLLIRIRVNIISIEGKIINVNSLTSSNDINKNTLEFSTKEIERQDCIFFIDSFI